MTDVVPTASPPRPHHAPHWIELSDEEQAAALARLGLPHWRAAQITRHYVTRFENDPTTWTDLPAAERTAIAPLFPVLAELIRTQRADGGATVKSLYRLQDGALVESVLMRYGLRHEPGGLKDEVGTTMPRENRPEPRSGMGAQPHALVPGPRGVRSTLCVSSQAGCGMACPFCATGQGGLQRNLTVGEIVEQVRIAAADLAGGELPGGPGRLGNVVFMGMGEPLANYRTVVTAIRRVTDPAPDGMGISARGVTVSTVGLVPRIAALAKEGLPVTLAVSLHAPDDDLRDTLCPVNRRWRIAEVLDAAKAYFDATGRRVSIEYALIREINDQAWRADRLATLLNVRGRGWAHVNVIPLNPTPGSVWTASDPAIQAAFVARLERNHVPVTVRDTRGRDIDGACGQLVAREHAADR